MPIEPGEMTTRPPPGASYDQKEEEHPGRCQSHPAPSPTPTLTHCRMRTYTKGKIRKSKIKKSPIERSSEPTVFHATSDAGDRETRQVCTEIPLNPAPVAEARVR